VRVQRPAFGGEPVGQGGGKGGHTAEIGRCGVQVEGVPAI
jgi:hypothetical protein